MYKVAILGCENSHANSFLDAVITRKIVNDIEFVGVFSEDMEASEKLHEKYGVYVAKSCDEFVGKVDAIMITARHGDNHFKYAKPYLDSKIPMFIDKPITCSEEEAKEFYDILKSNQIPVCGGSMCMFAKYVQELKKAVETEEYGKVIGGLLRSPVNMNNPYGDFFFYSQHLVQVMIEIFGAFPLSVLAVEKDGIINGIVRYDGFDVNICYTDMNFKYYAGINCADKYVGDMYTLEGCADAEFMEFYKLLTTGEMRQSYEEFFAPVYILNAILKAVTEGGEVTINRYPA